MKYLITGGCGFIGSNFADILLRRGEDVTVLDNLSRKGTIHNLQYLQKKYPEVKFVHCDIRSDLEKIRIAVEKADVIFHLAGQVAVTTSFINPREDFDINAFGTFNLLEAVRKSENRPIVLYASTNKVYGGMTDIEEIKKNNRYIYKDLPQGINEDRILDFHSPYGCSKGVSDQYVRDYSRMYKIKTVVLRQSCIYGTRQFGIEDQGWVAWFVIAAYLGKTIKIYGDGMQVRDLLFVDDLFSAWDLAVKNIDSVSGEVFNVGGGPAYSLSLLELLAHLNTFLKKDIEHSFDHWRPGDQPVYISDISKIKKRLNWEPTISPEEGVRKLVDWVAENIILIQNLFGE